MPKQKHKNLVEKNEYEELFKDFKKLTKSGGRKDNLNSWLLLKMCTNVGQLSIENGNNNKELPEINELKQIVTEICNEKNDQQNAIKSSFYAKNDIGTIAEKAMKNGQNILKRMKQKEDENEHDAKKHLQEFREFVKKFCMEFPEISKNSTLNKLMDKELVKPSDLFEFVLNKLVESFANETKLANSNGRNGGAAAKKLSVNANKLSHRRQKRRGRDPIPLPLLSIAFLVFGWYNSIENSPILIIFVFICLFIAVRLS
ncbi:hypothetical protein niasHT_003017 [Heterodera trifolii]|uniref:Uncharacterized protein n=1 Tax=Heterodera trifolii TaxID=157864 RepID=A0ABD2M4U9_9BILA